MPRWATCENPSICWPPRDPLVRPARREAPPHLSSRKSRSSLAYPLEGGAKSKNTQGPMVKDDNGHREATDETTLPSSKPLPRLMSKPSCNVSVCTDAQFSQTCLNRATIEGTSPRRRVNATSQMRTWATTASPSTQVARNRGTFSSYRRRRCANAWATSWRLPLSFELEFLCQTLWSNWCPPEGCRREALVLRIVLTVALQLVVLLQRGGVALEIDDTPSKFDVMWAKPPTSSAAMALSMLQNAGRPCDPRQSRPTLALGLLVFS